MLFVAYKPTYCFDVKHTDCVNGGVWVFLELLSPEKINSGNNIFIKKKEVEKQVKRIFTKVLSIAKCVLNAALAFAIVLTL